MSYKGEEGSLRPNQQYFERKLIEGCYVTRIRVAPSDSSKTYFWTQYREPEKVGVNEKVVNYCSLWQREAGMQTTLSRLIRQ